MYAEIIRVKNPYSKSLIYRSNKKSAMQALLKKQHNSGLITHHHTKNHFLKPN